MQSTSLQGRGRVVLVGRRLPDNENLGLGYLAASLRKAGFSAEILTLNTWVDMTGICERVLASRPALVGLALPDGGSSFLALGLGELLRRRGYRGHITAGGGFATLARRWLLERYGWLDSVVRFAGEAPLPRLVAAIVEQGGADIDLVPGVTTRQGDGLPAPVMDKAQVEIFPEHGKLPEILGHGAAHIAATRGCPGRCAYCGPSALQASEREEGKRAGKNAAELACAGVGAVRRRTIENLCDEMAALWHGRGVRYFYFVDEHLPPRREAEAEEFLGRWKQGLAERRVGPLGIGGMLRADLLTPAVMDAFADVGLVRSFVGIEFATDEEARAFGRPMRVRRGLEVMAALEKRRVAAICNIMLVHPDSTAGTLERGIDFLAEIVSGTFEATQMQVYHGTRLHARLLSEARLTGNPLRYGYTFLDETAGRFAEIFSRMRGEALRDFSVSFHVHDVALALTLARRLYRKARLEDLEHREREIAAELNALRIEFYRRGLELARRGGGFYECTGLIQDLHAAVARLQPRLERLSAEIPARLSRPGKIFSPMRAAAAFAVGFCLAGASLAGCYSSTGQPGDAASDPDAAAEVEAMDAAEDAMVCTDAAVAAVTNEVRATAVAVEPCLDMFISSWTEEGELRVIHPHWSGTMNFCLPSENDTEERMDRVKSEIMNLDLECFVNQTLYIYNAETEEKDRMEQTALTECPDAFEYPEDWFKVVIVVDSEGMVTDVLPRDELDPPARESMDCILSALSGLVFPCLANFQVCPEYVFIE